MLQFAPWSEGATYVWDGGHPAQNTWSSNHNWNPNGAPANDGTADLVFAGSIRLSPDVNGAWNINSISFDSSAGSFVIGGGTVTLQGTAVSHALFNDSTNTITFNNALVVGSNQTWNANAGVLNFNGTIALGTVELGAKALTLMGSADTLVAGVVSGPGSLVKDGTGTLTLSGANTYLGGTTVIAGTLQGTTTSLQGSIVNDASLVFDQTITGTYAGVMSGTGNLVKQNTGTVTLTGSNTYTGATIIGGGTLALGTANALASTTAVSVASGATLQLSTGSQTIGSFAGAGSIDFGANNLTAGGSNASTTFSGVISGTGALTKTGTGTLTLEGANTYSGGTAVNAGTLQGTTTSLSGSILNNASVVFDQSVNGAYAGVMSGTGSLTKQNTGTLTLSGANTFTGATTINGGTLALGTADALSDATAVSIATGATLQLASGSETIGSFAGAGAIALGANTLTAGGTNASTAFSGVISGTGAIEKTGTGALTLSGANTYSGGTIVGAGTLQGTATSLQGDIANNAAVVFDQASDGTYAGIMSGVGSLTKQSAGTLTLSGANTYAGGTTISAGTLQGDTTSLQGDIANNVALVFDQTTNGTFAGVVSGTGSLTKLNSGTLTLTGANTYSGGTTVSAGALQGSTTSLQGAIVNNAAVVFDQASNGTYAGVMSGTGSFTKDNSGTLTLSGANTYSGGTTVSAGALQGTTTSLQGNIVNQAAVVFDQATSGTYAGVMSGAGSLTKDNSGTLTLSGANTYSGGTTIAAGTLQGTTASLQGNIVNNAALVFDQSTSGSYAGVISGTGAVTKQNTGTVTLSGPNTHSGATTVAAGSLGLGADNAFSAASDLTLSTGTTVALNGYSAEVGSLAYHTAIIDYGSAGAANVFLFNGGSASTGTLTITNYSSGDGDVFAFRAGSSGIDPAFVGGVYFYGIGGGMFGASNQTLTGYSGLWNFITPDTTPFQTWDGGGTDSNWSTGANWVGDITPTGSTTLKISIDGVANTSPVLDGGSFNLNTLRFESTAGAFSLGASGGSALVFGGSVPGIIQLSASAQAIAVPLTLNATIIVETTGAGDLTLSGELSGSGGLTKVGNQTLVLSGASTHSGATTVGAGTLVLQNSAALGSTAGGTTVSSGATLQLENNIDIGAEALALNGTLRNASGTNSFAGAISGQGSLFIDAGALTLAGTSANTFTGATTIAGGTLALDKTAGLDAIAGNIVVGDGSGSATLRLLASNQISDTSAVTLTAGGTPVFDLDGQTETIGSLASTNTSAAVQLGTGGALATGGDNTSTTFAGVISGAGSLTKEGTGAFTLSGANTHSGATTVSAGTLVLQNSSALGTTAGGTTVSSGATLQLENNIGVGAEALVLDGTLRNASDTNAYSGAISGSGTVVVDSGALTLDGTAANTFTGATIVNSGTLDLAKTAGQNAVSGNLIIGNGAGPATVRLLASNQISDTSAVTLNAAGTPMFNVNGQAETIGSLASTNAAAAVQLGAGGSLATGGDNTSTAFAGVISGAGSLTKQGAGTFTVSGANTYSGSTTVSGGTLQGDTTSLQGGISNNAAVVFDQATNGTYSGAMSGTGSLAKQNAGTVTLSGANTYSGGTTVSGGTLQGDTASLQGSIANNAAVIFDQAANGTYSGAMSGTGSLTKQNSGTLTLSGANTYSGGTTIAAGTLQGNTTSLQGSITNNAAIVFDQAAAGTYSGAMSGVGSLTKQNSGTLTLSGANTYSGGTTVSGGALQGTTTSLQGNIVNNAAVVFDQAANGTYGGVISGTGSLTKQNTGTLTLTGANTFTGGTLISGGALQLGASNVLSDTGNLTLGYGGTFDLGGTFSERVNAFGFDNSTLNFGAAGTPNYFLIGSDGANVGTLTVANWSNGSDVFGVATNSVSQSFLDNVYFSGINVGIGAVLSSTPVSVGSYGNFYALTPIPTFVWDGGQNNGPSADQDNWGKANNWAGDIAPAVGAIKAIVMAGIVKTTNDMDGAYQIKSLLFRSDAGAFTIASSTGDTLTIGGGGINNQSLETQTLNVQIALSAGQSWTAASGNLVFNGATILNDTHTLTVTGSYDTAISAAIGAGSGGVVKDGTGTLTLSGANTFTGGVTINGGTLSIGSDGNLGATSGGLAFDGGTLQTSAAIASARGITLSSGGGTLDSNGFNSTLSGVISGIGGLTKSGAGTLTLSGANTYSGGTTISAGTLLGNTTSLQGDIVNNAALVFDQATTGTFAGGISGTGSVTKQNSGTLTLSGAHTYSGGTTVSGGTLQGDATSLQGNIANNAAVIFDQAPAGAYTGVMSGTGSLTKQSSGTLTLSGANTYSGATTISAGTVVLQHATALGSAAAGTTVSAGATLQLENNISVGAEALALDGALRNASGANSYSGAISGAGAVTVDGGTLALSGAAANSYSGATTVNAGTLDLGKTAGTTAVAGALAIGSGSGSATVRLLGSNQISDTSAVTFASGGTPTLNLNGNAETVGSIASANAAASIALGAGGSLAAGGDNSSTTFAGVISGAGSFTKEGSGALTLSGANTFTGGTTVTAGTLQGTATSLTGNIVNHAAVVFDQTTNATYSGIVSGTGSFTKTGAATLTLSGANTFSGSTHVAAGTLTLAASNRIAETSALTISSGATFDVAGFTQAIGSLAGSGTLALGGGQLSVGADNSSTTFGGAITGEGVFEKIGSGTLTFDGAINIAGELKLAGGTIALAGINLTVDTLRISGDTILDFGSSAASVLTATHVIIENAAILTINNWVDLQDFFYATGSFVGLDTSTLTTTPVEFDVRGSAPQDQMSFTGFSSSNTAWQAYDRQITPAPEPATYGALMIAAAFGFIGWRRWRTIRK